MHQSDYLSIGGGVAGLSFAIELARGGATVSIVTKKAATESNTRYAQGGIATVFGGGDSTESHIRDTLDAGSGLCDKMAVETAIREGPRRIEDLLAMGARFSREEDGQLSLGREGGHSHHRVVHADDWTGRELVRTLLEAARAEERVVFYEDHQAIDLIVDTDGHCRGAWVQQGAGKIETFAAPVTLLATGGAGAIFANTTNPSVATGDGVAMAYHAGATVANLEFIQFHPTALSHPEGGSYLISEALRGYGAVLVNHRGEAFVERQLRRGSLSTRDVVARAIVAEMKSSGRECVYLDVTGKDPERTRRRFPNIDRTCRGLGIDMTTQPIPVA
ncbi:MAG: FAD-binding protein, partial [Gemmatimonadetes bacterium]|nr:FAD-binding protein [Gemmatimonadota bacterium]